MAEQNKGVVDKAEESSASGAVDKAKGVTGSAVEKTKPLVDKAGDATISALDKAKGVTGTVRREDQAAGGQGRRGGRNAARQGEGEARHRQERRRRHVGCRRRDGRLVRRGEGGVQMVSAYILVQTEVGKASQVTDLIKATRWRRDRRTASRVPYDVIARAGGRRSRRTGEGRSSCRCRRSRASRERSPAPC